MITIHYLYRITNLINKKVYIGQTVNPSYRWWRHRNQTANAQPKQIISQAIKKYGNENFEFEVIACCQTQKDTDETEILLIQQYDSRNKEKGYNIAPGGFGTKCGSDNPMWGKTHSPEAKAKISAVHKGTILTEEHKEKISQALTGKIPNWTPEGLQAMSASKRTICPEHVKQAVSAANKGRVAWNKGKKLAPLSEEHKAKISSSMKK